MNSPLYLANFDQPQPGSYKGGGGAAAVGPAARVQVPWGNEMMTGEVGEWCVMQMKARGEFARWLNEG